MTTATLAHLDGDEAAAAFDEIVRIFSIVYADPPYNETDEERANFVIRATRQLQQPGFDLVTARLAGQLVGCAYGHTLPASTGWWDGLQPAPSADFVHETGARTFAVFELGVLAEFRGEGLGRRLVDELLRDRGEERATLATHPEATEVQRMYQRWGWSKVGRKPASSPLAPCPYFDIYLLPLP